MNKTAKIILVIVIILVLGGIGVMWYTNQQNKAALSQADNYLNQETKDADGDSGDAEKNVIPTTQAQPSPDSTTTPASPATMTAGALTLDPSATKVAWVAKKSAIATWVDTGSIGVKSGEVSLAEDGSIKSGKVVMDMTTIKVLTTGKGDSQDKLTTHLSSPDFFDVAKFPTAEYTITSAKKTGESAYDVTGDLTLKGQTHPQSMHGTLTKTGNTYTFEAEAQVNRTTWGIVFASSKVANGFIEDTFTLKIKAVTK